MGPPVIPLNTPPKPKGLSAEEVNPELFEGGAAPAPRQGGISAENAHPDMFPGITSQPQGGSQALHSALQKSGEAAWKHSPSIVGAAGGFFGGPAGAALGGAGMEAVKNIVEGKGVQPLDALKEGAVQGATEFGGGLISKGLGKVAPFLMRSATKAGPEISGQMLDRGITVSKGGAQAAENLQKPISVDIDNLYSQPTKGIDPAAVGQRLDPIESKYATSSGGSKQVKSVQESRQEFLDKYPATKNPPTRGPVGKFQSGGTKPAEIPLPEGRQTVKTDREMLESGKVTDTKAESMKGIDKGIREESEKIVEDHYNKLKQQIPDIKGLNDEEEKLLDIKGIISRALERSHGSGSIPTTTYGMLKKVADQPEVKSEIAVNLKKIGAKLPDTTTQQILRIMRGATVRSFDSKKEKAP
jgi:hypothetical protein